MKKYYYNAEGKVNKRSWMNLFIFAKLEPHEIAELLLRKQKDMEFHMKNFVNIKGIYTNRIGISSREEKNIW